ncbi:hypothetical protein DEJ23_13050 [Curtobacterium sp. MCSS17_008]|uniref:beta-1,6-N-acetylglucosaminyltransferase n=1 Tax=Curtobacterium sp. MCSS17_008 TaxID=2175647 RepID=UPI000DA7C740|nr:beta-1,6-N-acetylglucosaminyltransferase [Curtobacterium sp. MCSS17_008]PZF54948.1 hypothetical protein DEJ23_13050 [Curtobacterium sp. MCSS17_008]
MATPTAAPACVVLAHEDPVQVRRLVEALDPFPVFLHCDVRTTDAVHRAMTEDLPSRVRLLARRRTGWARWENAAAELNGYRAALAQTDASHIAVLTGSDYPLATPEEIGTLLDAHRGRSFLITHPLPHPDWRNGGWARFRYRHWAWRKHMLRLPVPRRLPRDVVLTGGSQMKLISREHARAVVDVVDARPDLVRFWRRVWIADESLVPSILGSPALVPGFAEEHVEHSPWFIGWDGTRMKSPPWLGTEDAGRLLERWTARHDGPPHLFARKFSTARSADLLDLVDAAVGLRHHRRHRQPEVTAP